MNSKTVIVFDESLVTSWTDFFPIAPGWYILLCLMVLVFFLVKKYVFNRQTKQATLASEALQDCIDDYKKNENTSQHLQDINALLRQVAIAQHGRQAVAHLSGKEWIRFLNATHSRKFNSEQAKLLSQDAYAKDAQGDIKKLHKSVQEWIKAQYKAKGSKS